MHEKIYTMYEHIVNKITYEKQVTGVHKVCNEVTPGRSVLNVKYTEKTFTFRRNCEHIQRVLAIT